MGGKPKTPEPQGMTAPVYATGAEVNQENRAAKLLETQRKGLASTQLSARSGQAGTLLGQNGSVQSV